MADTLSSALDAITALTGDEVFLVVDDMDGTPKTSRITVANVQLSLQSAVPHRIAVNDFLF